MHQDRGRLPPGRPLSLRANQATSLPGGPMRHTAREEPHAPIRAAVLSIRVCGTAAEPHAPIRATVPPALVCGAAPACRSCADRATRGRHHRRAAKTPCTNSAARRRCADRASRGAGIIATRRQNPMHQFAQPATAAVVRPPAAVAAPRQRLVHREDRSPGEPGDAQPRQNPMHLFSHRQARSRGNTPCPAVASRFSAASSRRRRRRRAAARWQSAAKTPCTNSGRRFGNTGRPGQARPHAPEAVTQPALPAISPSVQRDDGETRPAAGRAIIQLTIGSNVCYQYYHAARRERHTLSCPSP